jgi:putative ABC transport system permease protein
MNSLFKDIHYGFRSLLKHPGFTAVAVITLALGIGASTAIFSAVNPILFEPLPYPSANRIMMIWETRNDGGRSSGNAFGTYRGLVDQSRSFDAIAAMKAWQPTRTSATEPERLDGQRVSASYFDVLGVSPAMGRNFQPSEDQLNGSKVVILSDALWRRRFNSDTAMLGRQVTLDEESYTVIGVMPGTFENVLAPDSELWAPLQYDMSQGRAWGHHLRIAARLRPGVTREQAKGEIDVISHGLVQQHPRDYGREGFVINSLQEDITGGVKPALLAILGAVVLLLLIACVNVTNLLLARGAQRRNEFVMRVALGAGRTRLIRQLLTESLLLAAIGGALGMLVADLGVRTLVAFTPHGLPRAGAITLNGTVFLFGLGITTLIGLLVGLIPALGASRVDLNTGMQQTSRGMAGDHQFTRRALVVGEVALALMLLVSAGLLLRSLQRLFAVDPGFNASNVLTMQVQTAGQRFREDSTTYRFFEQALDAVRQVPGVTSASFTSLLPLSTDSDIYGAQFKSSPNDPAQDQGAFRYAVTPGYFETIGIPLRRGRLLDTHDVAGAPVAVVINESFAKRKFPDRDPIGQRLHLGRTDLPWYTVVGVVGDVKQTSLAGRQADAVYITPTQWYFADSSMSLVVRTRGDAAALAPAIRSAIWSVDKDQPIVRVATMDQLLAASTAERRFALILFQAFALVALLLAATGIYGLLSGSVAERTREIGVRLALGASGRDILTLVVRQGLTLTGLGIVIGVGGAMAASQAIVTMLFGVSRADPITYLGMIALLMGVAVVACWVPARRAMKVDPLVALRNE